MLYRLSPRRKYPSWGISGLRMSRRACHRPEWVFRLAKRKLRDPPSGLKPQATAMASSRVDLPLPFSPTKKVTGRVNSRRLSLAIAGMRKA